jgi:hypothetical protein
MTAELQFDHEYPRCHLVEFKIPGCVVDTTPYDVFDHISALCTMRKVDTAFADQLDSDDALWWDYDRKMRGELEDESMIQNDPIIWSHIQTIERALMNRVEFAVRQKNRVQHLIEHINPASERTRVIEAVQKDFDNVMDMVHGWNTTTMKELYEDNRDWLTAILEWNDEDEFEGDQRQDCFRFFL